MEPMKFITIAAHGRSASIDLLLSSKINLPPDSAYVSKGSFVAKAGPKELQAAMIIPLPFVAVTRGKRFMIHRLSVTYAAGPTIALEEAKVVHGDARAWTSSGLLARTPRQAALGIDRVWNCTTTDFEGPLTLASNYICVYIPLYWDDGDAIPGFRLYGVELQLQVINIPGQIEYTEQREEGEVGGERRSERGGGEWKEEKEEDDKKEGVVKEEEVGELPFLETLSRVNEIKIER